jgi:signal transduction histidine kinase
VVIVLALVEAAVRSVPWKPVYLVFVLALALALPWRRLHPLAVAGSAFAAVVAIEVATELTGAQPNDGLYAGAILLILPYTLVRWGSGRDAILGLPIMALFPWVSLSAGNIDIGESIAGTIILLFPAAIGASIRYRSASRERAIEQARLHEREQLARELHDTVAHHVSAIAIQAQAGRTVAATDPDAALRALGTIEEAASRTLAEMRAMVGVLRRGEHADLAPQPGVVDIRRLADTSEVPHVEVELSGDLGDIRPSVDTAVYRLAQESVTNARRHAQHATTVSVRVTGSEDAVRLTVRDDGVATEPSGDEDGFGLVGMAERAKLLGGTFDAGPHPERGWIVEAAIPRNGSGA